MGDQSAIEWTEATWNCLVGCTRVSAGCVNCYAERLVHRGLSAQHRGLTKIVNGAPHWTGEVRLVESALDLPLRWKKPRRIFVNSLSDLFHEAVPDEWIDRIFGVMARAWWHTFQVLTKRPDRMLAYLSRPWRMRVRSCSGHWPLPNIWLGVSIEDQATADERIPLLLQTPAAVRWVSYEPALGPVDFKPRPRPAMCLLEHPHDDPCRADRASTGLWLAASPAPAPAPSTSPGPARPSRRAARPECRCSASSSGPASPDLGVTTQPHGLGIAETIIHDGIHRIRWSLKDRKGGDPAEWPEDLRVRDYPKGS